MAGAGVGGGQTFDVQTAARYEIVVDGAPIAVFDDLVELSSAIDPSELPGTDDRGGRPDRRKPRPALASVTLKRGQNNDLGLFSWHRQAVGRDDAGRNAVLVAYSTNGTAVARYNLESAWPTKIAISGDKPIAAPAEVLYETVTLTCRGIERVSA
jgi:phage tail-like protein